VIVVEMSLEIHLPAQITVTGYRIVAFRMHIALACKTHSQDIPPPLYWLEFALFFLDWQTDQP